MKIQQNLLCLKLFVLAVLFFSCPNISIGQKCIDYEGNEYKTVKIGNQTWMAQNLRVRYFQNDEPITNMDSSKINTNGIKYTWSAVTDKRDVCPEGWHVPSFLEIKSLISFLGGEEMVKTKLQEAGFSEMYWLSTNPNSTDAHLIDPTAVFNPERRPYIISSRPRSWTFPVRCIKD